MRASCPRTCAFAALTPFRPSDGRRQPQMSGLSDEERREQERRSSYGELLLATLAASRRPLSFDELLSVVADRGARLSEVADWLANARASGMVDDWGFANDVHGQPTGPRLFVLAASARAMIRIDRRRSDRRTA